MNPGLNEINERLAAVGLPVSLTAASAAKLKEAAPRDRILRALDRAEHHRDAGARAFLDKTLRGAGLIGEADEMSESAANETQPDSLPEEPPRRQACEPAHGEHQQLDRPEQREETRRRGSRPSFHVYGGRAALTFELDETTAGVPTVALDGAQAISERQYNWSEKVRIQFTARELPVVAAVLLGVLPECSFSNHGPANDKGFSIAWQADRQTFFVKVWQGKGNLRAVPMPREDAFYVAQIVLRAIQQGSPARLDTAGTIACVRAFFGRG